MTTHVVAIVTRFVWNSTRADFTSSSPLRFQQIAQARLGGLRRFETRSLPALSRSYPRHFTFHVAHPHSLHSCAMMSGSGRLALSSSDSSLSQSRADGKRARQTGRAERPNERERVSQHVEISVESPAVAAASVTGRISLASLLALT